MNTADNKFYKLYADLAKQADLTSTEKLIICNLQDRSRDNGVAWPGYDRIAKDLGLSRTAVLNAVKSLEKKGWLVIDRQSGLSNRYRINTSIETIPVSKQYSNPYRNDTTTSIETIPELDQLNKTKRTRPNKGVEISIPAKLTSIDGFETAWSEWLTYRRERKLTVTPTCLKKQLAMLETQPDPVAVISKSIESGWQGLFPTKSQSSTAKFIPAKTASTQRSQIASLVTQF
jgi:DNA-binding Lrp family transcriptional regulator